MINAQNVLVGAPDQLVTGAILSAPMSVAIPSDTQIYSDNLTGFESSGYVSEDGVTMSLSKSFENIKDWSGSIVKRILTEFDGTLQYSHLEVNEFSLRDTFGQNSVSVTPATTTAGTKFKVSLSASDITPRRYIFKMKDGSSKIRIVLPNAAPTELEDIEFKKSDPIKLGVTLGCQPDDAGNSIYIFLDDGRVTS